MSDEVRESRISADRDELHRFAQRLQRLHPVSSAPDVTEMMYRAGYRAAVEERSSTAATHPPRPTWLAPPWRTWLAGPAGTIAAALLAVAAVAPIAYRQGVATVSSETRVSQNGSDERRPQIGDSPSHDVSNEVIPSGNDPTGSDETTHRSRVAEHTFGPTPGPTVDEADDDAEGGARGESTLRVNDWHRLGDWFDDPALADAAARAVPIR